MEFSLNKSDFLKELKLSQGAVEKKSTIPILSNVLVEAVEDAIVLTATDLEQTIRCSCPAKVKKQGSSTLPATLLLHYVQLLPEVTEIHFKLDDNFWMRLACGRAKARIAGMSRDSFPNAPEELGVVIAAIPLGQLVSMIGQVDYAISREESRFTLDGALLVLKEGAITMVSTDGHRLAFVERKAEISGAYRLLLPRKALTQLSKLSGSEDGATLVQISRDNNSLFFRIGERLLISRELTGNFPDYARVLPKELPHSVTVQREALKAALDRVAQFSDERSHAIRLAFHPGELKLQASDIETGESEESVEIEYAGPVTNIGLNVAYALDFLRATSESSLRIQFTNEKGAVEFQPVGDQTGEYRYVVMPMRI